MQPIEQFTKDRARDLLRKLAEQRQSQTPDRQDPDWMIAYWLQRMGYCRD